jgi:phosphoglycerol transferase MdoB-like AlkP superfamily enzyme
MERLALHTSHQVALASHIVRMNIARYVAYFLTYFLVGLLGLLAVLVVWSSAPWPGRLMPWTLALCILAATAFLSALHTSHYMNIARYVAYFVVGLLAGLVLWSFAPWLVG